MNIRKTSSQFSREERAARQNGHTLYHQLLELGFTDADIEKELNNRPETRRISLVAVKQDGGTVPIIGVRYGGDYRAEEEWGLPEIARAFEAGDYERRVFSKVVDGYFFLGLRADGGINMYKDKADKHIELASHRAATEVRNLNWRDYRLRVSELREILNQPHNRQTLTDAGITALPRRKDELFDLLRVHVRKVPDRVSVGEFHFGNILVFAPAEPVITAAVKILAESGTHLRLGGKSTPFGRGATLFDERDLTNASKDAIAAHSAYEAEAMRLSAAVNKLLRERVTSTRQ